jgi:hypothetical protein
VHQGSWPYKLVNLFLGRLSNSRVPGNIQYMGILFLKSCGLGFLATYMGKIFLKNCAPGFLATFIGKIFLKGCAPGFLVTLTSKSVPEKLCTRVSGNIN